MNALTTITRTVSAPLSAVRSYLPSERKARREIASRFAASVSRKAPATSAPGFWPWARSPCSL
jgi:hypothetical protein